MGHFMGEVAKLRNKKHFIFFLIYENEIITFLGNKNDTLTMSLEKNRK